MRPHFLTATKSDVSLARSPSAIEPSAIDLKKALQDCRQQTLALTEGIQPAEFCAQPHPDFSPVGWHLGHIAYTESLWILGQSSSLRPSRRKAMLFAADGLPKAERQNLPPLAEVLGYLGEVRSRVETALRTLDTWQNKRLWHWLIQHESQHAETISMVLAMHRHRQAASGLEPLNADVLSSSAAGPILGSIAKADIAKTDMVSVEAGEFYQGSDAIDAIDNERAVHPVSLGRYWIDRTPVTCAQYRQFIEADGYQNAQWWSPSGWEWQQSVRVNSPLYWPENSAFDDHPVCGASWYEAEAYARFVGKRLPTEAEWAKAAGWNAPSADMQRYPWGNSLSNQADGKAANAPCNYGHRIGRTTSVTAYPQSASPYGCLDMLGNVWEWTDTWFDRYPGFQAFPYEGYSQTYFDGAHRVLRGGSWATPRWTLRNSFRNWYHPHKREMFAGFRCAL